MILEPSTTPVLELHDATKRYETQPPVTALAGVSLCVSQGELVAILVPRLPAAPAHLLIASHAAVAPSALRKRHVTDTGGLRKSDFASVATRARP